MGVKNPRYLVFVLQGNGEEDKTWKHVIDPFKYNARVLVVFQHDICFSYINFIDL